MVIHVRLLTLPTTCTGYLRLDSNSLTGGLPTEIGTMSALQHLNLQDNLLTGELPIELTLLPSIGECLEILFSSRCNVRGLPVLLPMMMVHRGHKVDHEQGQWDGVTQHVQLVQRTRGQVGVGLWWTSPNNRVHVWL